jgi:hypothetical protein
MEPENWDPKENVCIFGFDAKNLLVGVERKPGWWLSQPL